MHHFFLNDKDRKEYIQARLESWKIDAWVLVIVLLVLIIGYLLEGK